MLRRLFDSRTVTLLMVAAGLAVVYREVRHANEIAHEALTHAARDESNRRRQAAGPLQVAQ